MHRQVKFENEISTGEQGSYRDRSPSAWNSEQPDEGAQGNLDRIRKFSRDIVETVRRKSYVDSICVEENVDGGYAWVILVVIFVINSSTFGSARAYSLIFEYSARQDQQSRSQAALPFTIMGSVENMAGPLTGYLLVRTGSWKRVVLAGSCLVTLSHLLAAYFSSAPGQIATMGLMCGIGQSFISISSFQINNAYFERFRSCAFGVGLTGAAVGTIYISPLCQLVLDHHSKALCYVALSLILVPNIALSLLLKLKEKTPMHLTQPTPEHSNQNSRRGSYDNDIVPTLAQTASPTSNRRDRRKFSIHEFALAAAAADTTIAAQIPTTLASSTWASMSDGGAANKRRHSEWPTIFTSTTTTAFNRRQSREAKAAAANKEIPANVDTGACREDESCNRDSFGDKVREVLRTPLFHLIWPTQLLFCWLNFVMGMIITDFGKDRGLSETQNSRLIIVWASGQVIGRLCLGSLIDTQIISYKSFTALCFACISVTSFVLNSFGRATEVQREFRADVLIFSLVFMLSMFISTLYILFNGLVLNYMEKSIAPLSIGISSFTGSFFLVPRAWVIGKYRDTCGNYDAMLQMFTCVTMISALVWLVAPALILYLNNKCGPAAGDAEKKPSAAQQEPNRGEPTQRSKDSPFQERAKRCYSLPVNRRTNSANQIGEPHNSNNNSNNNNNNSILPNWGISSGKPIGLGQIPTIEEERC